MDKTTLFTPDSKIKKKKRRSFSDVWFDEWKKEDAARVLAEAWGLLRIEETEGDIVIETIEPEQVYKTIPCRYKNPPNSWVEMAFKPVNYEPWNYTD